MRSALLLLASVAVTVGLCAGEASAQPRPTPAPPQNTCTAPKTTCGGHSGYYAAADDIERVTAVADPILRDVRACLDKEGGKHVPAVLVIRWSSEGEPVDVRIDVPGYESLPCVQKAKSKLAVLQNPHETAIRCEFGCALPTTKPAPVVVPTPVPTTPTQPQAAPAPTPTPAPAPAPAPAPVTKAPEQPKYEKVWYGYQTLVADGLSFGLMIGGIASHANGATTAGYLGFLLGTPIVHMAHGNVGPGFGSFGLRLLLPLLGLGVGAIAGVIIGGTSGSGDFDRFGNGANGAVNGAILGALIGAGGCVLIDAASTAYTKERVDDHASLRMRPFVPRLTVAPTFGVQREAASVGIIGSF